MDKKTFIVTIVEALIVSAIIIGAVYVMRTMPTPAPTPEIPPTVVETTSVLSPTETLAPTEVLTEEPTATPTEIPTPTPAPTATPTTKPNSAGGKAFKPYTDWHSYNVKNSQQYKLQQIAKTAENGVRIVLDPNGEWRYCVALGTAWAGGQPEHIGRCVDVYMKSGAVIKCVLADVKRQEHTIDGKNRYGLNGDLLEFIVDKTVLNEKARVTGNVSYADPSFEGTATGVTALEMWIEGFGKEVK